jgi:hypothetical protein
VQDFPIQDLLDGDYTVFVNSDQPIFASVRVAAGNDSGKPRIDFAWLDAAEEITSARAVASSEDLESLLVLGNGSGELVTAVITNLKTGATSRISVGAKRAASVEMAGAVSIESEAGIYATVISSINSQIMSLGVSNQTSLGGSVPVRFR